MIICKFKTATCIKDADHIVVKDLKIFGVLITYEDMHDEFPTEECC